MIPDVHCTTNPFINPIYELAADHKTHIKWCPGYGDKWRWNINLGGAFHKGVW